MAVASAVPSTRLSLHTDARALLALAVFPPHSILLVILTSTSHCTDLSFLVGAPCSLRNSTTVLVYSHLHVTEHLNVVTNYLHCTELCFSRALRNDRKDDIMPFALYPLWTGQERACFLRHSYVLTKILTNTPESVVFVIHFPPQTS